MKLNKWRKFQSQTAGVRSGCLVSPTDTVPALAVRPDRAELIFAAKAQSKQAANFDGSHVS